MRINALIAGFVAATLAAGGAFAESELAESQLAQSEAPAPNEDGATTAPELAPEATPEPGEDPALTPPPPGADAAALQAHLDELFRRLADPDAEDWERVQAQIIRAWSRSGSDSMDLLSARADKAMEKQDYDTALLHLNDLVRLAPDYAEGWAKRATVHFLREDYGHSLEDISHALRLEPRHFGVLSGLGIILDRIGDPAGALEAYRRVQAINPHMPGVKEGIKKLELQVEGQRL